MKPCQWIGCRLESHLMNSHGVDSKEAKQLNKNVQSVKRTKSYQKAIKLLFMQLQKNF